MTTQRDRLIAVLHATDCSCLAGPCFPDDIAADYGTHADALLARGVRVVDADTLAKALAYDGDIRLARIEAAAILAALDAEAER